MQALPGNGMQSWKCFGIDRHLSALCRAISDKADLHYVDSNCKCYKHFFGANALSN